MLNWFKPSQQAVLGIDISSTTVKLIHLVRRNTQYEIVGYAVEVLPAGAVQEREIIDIAAVGQTITKAVEKSGTTLTEAAIAVAGSAVITKIIEMPSGLSDNELGMQIEFTADKHIPYPLQDVYLDFQVLGPSDKHEGMDEVLLVVSRAQIVDARVAALEAAGLKATYVDVESFAVERVYNNVLPNLQAENQIVAVFDIGAELSALNIIHKGHTLYTREQLFGGSALTDEIQQRYQISREAAGMGKRRGGLPDDYENEVLQPFKEALVQQLSGALQYFFSSSQYTAVDQIILGGGSAHILGLDIAIAEDLGIPTHIVDLFEEVKIAKNLSHETIKEDGPALMVACGLALRSFTG